ncbi:MAG UNVERIFIED_CONTAM: class I SAM-dependent methyltransferase [Planctomycetaceae bacterium]|jgi:2-polyprenyl-3-methyl-5-hydroxy-6-metoxy-1,4-benzoquinol methylase
MLFSKKPVPKFIHKPVMHSDQVATPLVELIHSIFRPKTVVDIGCGPGNFLSVFKRLGAEKVLGIDGPWVPTELRNKYLHQDEFIEHDLENRFSTPIRYDLAICLEVAEHLAKKSEDNILESLVAASDNIVFSAAIPGQEETGT